MAPLRSSVAWTSALIIISEVTLCSAISYLGGYTPDQRFCIDICVNGSTLTCFNNTGSQADFNACRAKTRSPGDWDYAPLDQIYAPQFCRDLAAGIDITVTHQNVLPYPNGTQCIPKRTPNRLLIHGLWNNYNAGFAGCCFANNTNAPLDPEAFACKYPKLLKCMDKEWRDPTQPDIKQSLCQNWDHEWQKHGYCVGYKLNTASIHKSAANYFDLTLRTAKQLKRATDKINQWAKEDKCPMLVEVRALYPKYVQVFCSGQERAAGRNRFQGVRSCFARPPSNDVQRDGLVLIDCPVEGPAGNIVPCNATVPLSLAKFSDPSKGPQPDRCCQ